MRGKVRESPTYGKDISCAAYTASTAIVVNGSQIILCFVYII
jgi:hypothetical protein